MPSKKNDTELLQKFTQVTGVTPRVSNSRVSIPLVDFIEKVIPKLRNPRLTVHSAGRKAPKIKGVVSMFNPDVDACFRYLVRRRRGLTRHEVQEHFGWSERKTNRVLKTLTDVEMSVVKEGAGSSFTYKALKD